MAKFCQNCGSPLGEGVRFCSSCGSPVPQAAQPQQPKSSPNPQPQANPQPHSYTPRPQVRIPEQFAQRNAARAQQQAYVYQQSAAPAAKKKGKGGLAAVSLLLVAAIVVGIFGFRNGGWFRGGKEPKPEFGKVQASEKGSVSAESPAITLCGVTVDVDTLMLESGKRDVSVSVYESGTEADGTRYEAYELEMGKHEDFYVPVAVTFPCRVQSGTDVIVEHYKDGNWMPLLTFVNEEAGTATAYFGSFSPARVTYRPVGSNPSLYKVVADEDNPYLLTLAVVSNYWNI
ncbi:MAG: zinc-ribbon domain-containing protein, partial [Clostridia bacterium]|nr:zinc-ribbon domain-containing protein [Clostridia bacterium]